MVNNEQSSGFFLWELSSYSTDMATHIGGTIICFTLDTDIEKTDRELKSL